MAGIYIHIPFCRQACHYCNFHFSTSTQLKQAVVNAISTELLLQKNYAGNEIIETIYFGGGTPSLLSAQELSLIFTALHKNFTIAHDAEITLEANPDDINSTVLKNWQQQGINRLSMGVQSFFEDDLQWMNRAHNATQAKQSILLAQQHGFNNITIDLIYGLPILTNEKWKANVDAALQLNVSHLSCYALTVEPKTALQYFIKEYKKQDVDAAHQSAQFLLLMQWMSDAGFEHYEISNFALPGKQSRHNTSYWQGKTYLGIGPAAHSFNGQSRQLNIANNALYIKSIEQHIVPFEVETLTAKQKFNEYVMTALRTSKGIDLTLVLEKFGKPPFEYIVKHAQPFVQTKKVLSANKHLLLTNEGKLFADGIASDLFML
jgi:oxygen-independent coproporphyrinogen III oxidase